MYNIREHSFNRLDMLNERLKSKAISIQPSTKKTKKIDVLINGKVIASIGDINSMDYGLHLERNGKEYADRRRASFYNRFKRLPDIKDNKITNMFWARLFLW